MGLNKMNENHYSKKNMLISRSAALLLTKKAINIL